MMASLLPAEFVARTVYMDIGALEIGVPDRT
jgi:hypothetical protein